VARGVGQDAADGGARGAGRPLSPVSAADPLVRGGVPPRGQPNSRDTQRVLQRVARRVGGPGALPRRAAAGGVGGGLRARDAFSELRSVAPAVTAGALTAGGWLPRVPVLQRHPRALRVPQHGLALQCALHGLHKLLAVPSSARSAASGSSRSDPSSSSLCSPSQKPVLPVSSTSRSSSS
jgi:hypothetical protein